LVVAREKGASLGDPFFDVAEDVLRRIELRLLMEESDRQALRRERFADKLMVLARHDSEERALSGAVQAEDANLRARQKREPDVFKNLGVGRMNLPETFHGIDELGHK